MQNPDDSLFFLLDFAAAAPALLGWHSVPLPSAGSAGLLFLADSRAEGTMMILEAVAGQHGRLVASDC